jgi:hypothetical protein
MNDRNEGLEEKIAGDQKFSHFCGWAVVIGLVIEVVLAFAHQKNASFIENWAPVLSAFLVAVGVFGEIHFSGKASKSEEELRRISNEKVAEANERASTANLEMVRLQVQLAARTISEEQFNILQKLKGKVRAVIVASDVDAEPAWFAHLIALVLQKADIEVGLITRKAEAHSTGNFICDRLAFHNPNGAATNGEPLFSAFNDAGIPMSGIVGVLPMDFPEIPADIPIIVIGGRFVIPPNPPYLGSDAIPPPVSMLERMRNP